ncbi:LytTR family transcriptional regulator DNA-binding domain-containing protein [Methylobacterium sp. Leaf118]|uniref:LytTR family transcriptional regulator DNA-binding domain-containing protein n=1 Tax=Methylobacterium sp. Leaf118 TaxID=2876562 RepID=UPI001E4287D4|nr:LytTR family transcriptional regulator DNA-binding domain-containing protein [Methylobacterium sp. Leaf118]
MIRRVTEADTPPAYEILSEADCADAPDSNWAFLAGRALLTLPVDAAISAILEALGRAAESDRAWMFEYDSELVSFRNSHEWSRRGITSFVHDLQDAPVTMFAWLHRHLANGRAVMVNRVEGLPRTARSLQAEMYRQNDKSILAVPIIYENRIRSAFGFDAVRQYHRWPDAEVKALFQCAQLIAAARYGRRAGEEGTGQPRSRPVPLIYLRARKGVRGVEPSAIVCLRSARNVTEILLADGSRMTDLRSFGLWSGLLSPASFVKVHRTAIVNLLHVRAVTRNPRGSWSVELRHLANALPISRSGREALKTRMGL